MKPLRSLILLLPVIAAAQTVSTAITSRVSALLNADGVVGTQGLYLKEVGGSVLANQQERFGFDPGTATSGVPLAYALSLAQSNTISLDSQVIRLDSGAAACPNQTTSSGSESLRIALREMMWHSDNARTHALQTTFGRNNLDAFAHSIGMTGTSMPPIPGCATGTPGRLTLTDAARLYEGVLTGALLPTSNTFLGLLPGKAQFLAEGSDWNHIWDTDIPNMIRQEAPAGLTAAQLATYQAPADVGYKSGSTVVCLNVECTKIQENFSIAGWARVPYCTGKGVITRDYIFGLFLANANDDGWFAGKKTAAGNAFTLAKGELFREQFHDGLLSCFASDPVLVSPRPGATLNSRTVIFSWSAGTNWDGYRLDIGRLPGATDYASIVTSSPTAIATNLPCDGRVLNARLWTHNATGYVNPRDYVYNACTNGGPLITSPRAGTNLESSSVTFEWTELGGADGYRLEVGNAPQTSDIGFALVAGSSATINNIPTDGRAIFVRITAHTPAGYLTPNDYAYNNLVGQTPIISSVVNAASLLPSLSPVCLATVTGSNFSTDSVVLVGTERAVPVGPLTPNQITFIVPAGAPIGPASVTVSAGRLTSARFPVTLTAASPGLYPTFSDAAGVTISAGHSAKPGDVVQALAVGLGGVNSNGTPVLPVRVLVGAGKTSATVASIVPDATAGIFQVKFRIPEGMAGGSQPVTLVIGTSSSNTARLVVAGPAIESVLNGASFSTTAKVAPGSIVSLFGSDLAAANQFSVFPSAALPGGGSITFNGVSAPLFDVVSSVGQINLLVPFELPSDGNVTVVVANASGTSAPFLMAMAPTAPGIFRLNDPSDDQRSNAAALLANTAWRVVPNSMASALGIPQDCKANGVSVSAICGQPASPGDVVQIYVTGLGRATPNGNPGASTLRTGDVAPANGGVLYRTVDTPQVTVGGVPASVLFSGIAPGFAGLYQVNVVLPATAPAGDDVPVVISIGGASDSATIAIHRP